jgi:hypothetical protein
MSRSLSAFLAVLLALSATIALLALLPVAVQASATDSCPRVGQWSGSTDQGLRISFTVAAAPCRVETLRATHRLTCTRGLSTTERTITATWNYSTTISGGRFAYGDYPREVQGSFSHTCASGTWILWVSNVRIGSCTGSGTWTACKSAVIYVPLALRDTV